MGGIFGTACRLLYEIPSASLISFPSWFLEPHKATACVHISLYSSVPRVSWASAKQREAALELEDSDSHEG